MAEKKKTTAKTAETKGKKKAPAAKGPVAKAPEYEEAPVREKTEKIAPAVKQIDFESALAKQTILKGFVVRANDKAETPHIQLNAYGCKVIILKDDCVNFPYAKTLMTLVGEEVLFCVKEIYPTEAETKIYGSMKIAYEKKRQPIMDALHRGDIVEGVVQHITPHGAYISINGVQGFLKNYDFSDDGTAVGDIYQKGDKVKVRFKRMSANNNILFLPEEMRHGSNGLKPDKIKKGEIYAGKVVDVYPDKVFVNILPGVDMLCHVPRTIADVEVGNRVKVHVKNVINGDNGKLLVRGEITDKVYDRRDGGDVL